MLSVLQPLCFFFSTPDLPFRIVWSMDSPKLESCSLTVRNLQGHAENPRLLGSNFLKKNLVANKRQVTVAFS